MKKKHIKFLLISAISFFIVLNLTWLIFIGKGMYLRNKVPYDRIQMSHRAFDDDAPLFWGGFDDYYYLNFTALGYVSMPHINDNDMDELLIEYRFLRGYTYTYNFFPGNAPGKIPGQTMYQIKFDSNRNLIHTEQYEMYEQYKNRIEELFEKADSIWGFQ